jgi:hypothetical protein
MVRINTAMRKFLGSSRFFQLILGLLVVQAAWIALSGRYPMAFDEDFHLGLIRLYADHVSPFWSAQPAGADALGAVARDPSYLYHWLMSFPYRLIGVFTDSQTIQVLFLRFLNIGLFAAGLVLFRRLLLKTGVSGAMVHFALLIFVLLPVAPLLAAQINYDNLILPLTALALLLAVKFDAKLKRRFDLVTLWQLALLCLLAGLVKYAFLPIALVLAVFVIGRVWQRYRAVKPLWRDLAAAWRALGGRLRLGLVISLFLALGLFGERYAVNLARYHAPVPDCADALSAQECRSYGPWLRDYDFKRLKSTPVRGPLYYTEHEWLYGMWLRSFFMVDGPGSLHQTRGPLTVPAVSAIAFTVVAVLAGLLKWRQLLRRYRAPVLWLFLAVSLGYLAVLWLNAYQAYVETGQPVAINGRYLLPVLPLLLIIAVAAGNEVIKRHYKLKAGLAALVIICLLWGGGALTYILRSNDAWYWNSGAARTANHAVQRTLGPLTPGYRQLNQYLR